MSAAWTWPLPLATAYCLFLTLLVGATFIDFDHYIIPNSFTIGGAVAGLVASALVPALHQANSPWSSLGQSALGGLAGFLALWIVVELGKLAFGRRALKYEKPEPWKIDQPDPEAPPRFTIENEPISWWDLFTRKKNKLVIDCATLRLNGEKIAPQNLHVHEDRIELPKDNRTIPLEDLDSASGSANSVVIPREAMGFGDVLFLMMFGTFLGWIAVLWIVAVSSVLGSVVGITTKILGRAEWSGRLPFGPYLAAAALLWLWLGARSVNWYLQLTGLADRF